MTWVTEQRTAGGRASARLDRFDFGVLLALAGLSLAFLFWVFVRGGVFGGWEGYVVADQGQYLVWIREAGEHVLIANRFDMRPDDHVFLHPTLLLSGVLYALGVSAPVAYLLWKPVAVLVLFAGVWRFVRAHLEGRWDRRAALVVALFFVSPAAVLSPLWGEKGRGTFDFISGEIWPAGHLWGYPMSAIAVGLTPLVFLWAARAVTALRETGVPWRARSAALAAGAAMLVSALHPWQGAMIIAVVGVAALWAAVAREARWQELARALWPVLVAPLLPAAYYFVLRHADASWEAGTDNYATPLDWTMTGRLALALAPLALPALLGYRGRVNGLGERVLRLWAPLGLVLYLFPGTPVRFHAFNGLSIPLAVLAARGLAPYGARARAAGGSRRGLAVAVAAGWCALLVLPGTVDRVRSARGAVYLNQQPFNLDDGEARALDAIADNGRGGGVLTSVDLAAIVPYWTGHETWVATPSWTPDFGPRAAQASNLFAGRLDPAAARSLVRGTGVRYVLSDCRTAADLGAALASEASVRRYGCATLYELRPGS